MSVTDVQKDNDEELAEREQRTFLEERFKDKGDAIIETFTGKQFNLFDDDRDRLDDIDIVDIAHGLSMNCRYNGHVKRFYSVAEHAVYISYLVDPEYAYDGLHHDDSEAYLSDMPRPFKKFIENYKDIEHNVQGRIALALGFNHPEPRQVKLMDTGILWVEAQELVCSGGQWWHPSVKRIHDEVIDWSRVPYDGIQCWTPEEAERKYTERHNELREKLLLNK